MQNIPDKVFNYLADKLNAIEVEIAELEMDRNKLNALIDDLSADYREIAQFVGITRESPCESLQDVQGPIVESSKPKKRGRKKADETLTKETQPTKHNSSIDEMQKEAQARGLSYGQLQVLKRQEEEGRKHG